MIFFDKKMPPTASLLTTIFVVLSAMSQYEAAAPVGCKAGTTLLTARLPTGFFSPVAKNISAITIKNADFYKVKGGVFESSPSLQKLDLSGNSFTYLPPGLFDNLTSLNDIALDGIAWYCGCVNGWFFDWAVSNGASITGGMVCSTPSTLTSKGFRPYYLSTCKTTTGLGVSLGDTWLPIQDLVIYGVTLITLILSITSLGCICCIQKKIKGGAGGSGGAPKSQKINVRPSNGTTGGSKFRDAVQRAQAANRAGGRRKVSTNHSGKVTPSDVTMNWG